MGCMPVQTEAAFQKVRSQQEPHIKVAHISFEETRLQVICAVHSAIKQSGLGYIR